ncbi:hypothetical protein [Consotaella salsifontis]|uniref:Uncharacterized protein n=1 Tax=Consotaella salsifontis TaxID=1365950 RepID=A0A1T4MGF2_9HYPH|nr:hypothetical protein [Consotaella salsifontis]SJZ65936.1 hypothetical protein SAMN05428963_102108 [Consotaella salsifontis]
MTQETALAGMEQALRAAARSYIENLRTSQRQAEYGQYIASALARLGYPPPAHGWPVLASGIDSALAARLRQAVVAEMARLLRLARSGHPAYDVNRHIATSRALAWLDGRDRDQSSREGNSRPSGKSLNSRFVRRAHRRGTSRLAGA